MDILKRLLKLIVALLLAAFVIGACIWSLWEVMVVKMPSGYFAALFITSTSLALWLAVPMIYFALHIGASVIAYSEGESLWWEVPIFLLPVIGPLAFLLFIYMRGGRAPYAMRKISFVYGLLAWLTIGAPVSMALPFMMLSAKDYALKVVQQQQSKSVSTTHETKSKQHQSQ
jgi:hypothetical protein